MRHEQMVELHPNMPWNYTELWMADWQNGKLSNERVIIGREAKASVMQPQWSCDGSLFFVDTRTGYWQLYRYIEGTTCHIHVQGLEKAEFRSSDWWLGRYVVQYLLSARADLVSSTYAPLTEDTLIAFYNIDGSKKAIVIDVEPGDSINPGFPINHVAFNALKRTSDTSFAITSSTSTAPQSFFHLDITKPDDIKFPRDYGAGEEYAYGISFLQQTPNTQPRWSPSTPNRCYAWWSHLARGPWSVHARSILDHPRPRSGAGQLRRLFRLLQGVYQPT